MSFILDALKKSESERQRQAGPALLHVRVAPPRGRLPMWAIAIALLLLVNGAILGAVLVKRARSPADAATDVAVTPPVTTPLAAPAAGPPPAATASPPMQPVIPPAAFSPLPDAPPPAAASPGNPADFEPATAPRTTPLASAPAGTDEANEELPGMEELNAVGAAIPPLTLNLHVYDAQPQRRYIWLNMKPMREGEVTAEGVRLERITERGAVLAWRGRRFNLPRGD